MKINVFNPGKLPLIDYRNLSDLQGDLKEMNEVDYYKLVNTLKVDGFDMPLAVWFDPEDGDKPYIFDGHGRIKVMTQEEMTPYKLPFWPVHAPNKEEAKKKLLRFNSQYHKMTQEGFDEFTADLDEDWIKEYTSIRGVYTYEIEPVDFNEFFEEVQQKQSETMTLGKIIFNYPEDQIGIIEEKFEALKLEGETNELLLLRLISQAEQIQS